MAVASALAGQAGAGVDRQATQFDRPAKVETLRATSDADPVGKITCTYYPGLMVRETGTDSPDPGPATLIRFPSARPVCSRTAAPAGAIVLKTAGYSLIGRKGPFLAFGETDPNGAVLFMVIAAIDGRELFRDGETEAGLRSATLWNGALRLRYTRGVNAPCSVVKDGSACWARLAHDGAIPPALAHRPPPTRACASAYRRGQTPTPADDPSLITYDVDVTVDGSGGSRVIPRGAVGCEAMP
jgi:hypothetical protein